MITVEIILILIGVIFLIGSFMIKDKLSKKDIEQISALSQEELKIIVDKQLASAKTQIEDAIEESIEDSKEITIRSMERESNDKIMAISEYSDTVLESMNQTHNEIMFLYSMLNDKHKEMTEFAGELQTLSSKISGLNVEDVIKKAELIEEPAPHQETLESYVVKKQEERSDIRNNNDDILLLHNTGKTDIEIAKELGLGLGEVKLVIGLFKGAASNEI